MDKPRRKKSTLFVFHEDGMYLAELELSGGLQEMLSKPVGDPSRFMAWSGVLLALMSMVEQAR